ncbi:hypothetical protein CPB86DRAFT_790074 [Serendipita vermifera]|nr:hypothetical protein CPB86DRAFT_790074 [Serendipita vermifera]
MEEPHINYIEIDVLGASPPKKVDVSGVPVEIWEEIFLYYTEPQDSVQLAALSSLKTTRSMNVALSHVCRLFRNIVLSMPSLWTTLDPSLPVARFNAFAERSSQLPITIEDTKHIRLTVPSTHAQAFQNVQNRIVKIRNPIYFDNLYMFHVQQCRNLQYLISESEDWRRGPDNLKQILRDFKELKSFTWRCPYYLASTRFSSPINYGLTNLRITSILEEVFVLDLLRSCPLLERGAFQTVGYQASGSEPTVSLPCLKDLDLGFAYMYNGWLWKLQGTPILDVFCFHAKGILHSLTNNLSMPFRLTSLEFHGDVDSDLTLPWLKDEPGVLRSLTLSGIPIQKLRVYLDTLKCKGERLICPQLEEFRFLYKRRRRKRSEGDLWDIYSSRCRAGLKALRIVWGDKFMRSVEVNDTLQQDAYTGSDTIATRVRWVSVERNKG